MKLKKIDILLLVLSVLSLIGHLFLVPQMPETVPIHWNTAGEADGYAGRLTTGFLAALPLLLHGLFLLLPRLDPRGKNYEKHQKAYDVFRIFFTLFFIAVVWVSNAAIMGYPVSINQFIPIGLGILFLIMGNYMPQIRSNYTFGIKTPWALESPYVWKKTHAAGGVVFCIYGVVMIAAGIFPESWISSILAVILIAGVIGLYLYSWLIYKKEQKYQ